MIVWVVCAINTLPAFALDPPCAKSQYLLCDGFETSPTGKVPNTNYWSLELGEGSLIVIDDGVAAAGARSAKVTVTQGRKWAYMQTKTIFPVAESVLWGRMYVRIRDNRPQSEGLVHWNLIEAIAESNPIKMYRYGGISVPELGRNHFNWNYEMRPRPEGFKELSRDDDRTARVPHGEWICVEWMFDTKLDESRFFWNGTERPSLHVVGGVDGTRFDMVPFRALNIGFTIYQPILAEYVAWIDEIAIDHARIGCLT